MRCSRKLVFKSEVKGSINTALSLSIVIPCIMQSILDPQVQHGRTAAAYIDYSKPRNRREVVSRRDATRLARLSSAYDIHLLSLKHLLDPSVDPIVHNVANRRILLNS